MLDELAFIIRYRFLRNQTYTYIFLHINNNIVTRKTVALTGTNTYGETPCIVIIITIIIVIVIICIVETMNNIFYGSTCHLLTHSSPGRKRKRAPVIGGPIYSAHYTIIMTYYIGLLGHSTSRLPGESKKSDRVRWPQRFARNLRVSRKKK